VQIKRIKKKTKKTTVLLQEARTKREIRGPGRNGSFVQKEISSIF
jgi:hypothetical protein